MQISTSIMRLLNIIERAESRPWQSGRFPCPCGEVGPSVCFQYGVAGHLVSSGPQTPYFSCLWKMNMSVGSSWFSGRLVLAMDSLGTLCCLPCLQLKAGFQEHLLQSISGAEDGAAPSLEPPLALPLPFLLRSGRLGSPALCL